MILKIGAKYAVKSRISQKLVPTTVVTCNDTSSNDIIKLSKCKTCSTLFNEIIYIAQVDGLEQLIEPLCLSLRCLRIVIYMDYQ